MTEVFVETSTEEVPQMASSPEKWRILLRQSSVKIGTFAENVVLPKNQRNFERSSNVTFRDVDEHIAYMPTANPVELPPKSFPTFIIGVSLIQVVLMYSVDNEILQLLFEYDPYRRHEIWRYITIMFVHSGPTHLWGNMIFQLILGILLEIVHHWKRIAIIYFASIVGGSLFITVLKPQTYAVGASAGMYGLLFSHLSTIILNWNEMDRRIWRLSCLSSYIFYEIDLSFYGKNISYAGHFGGAVTGFLVSFLVLKNLVIRPWEKKMQKICVHIITVLCVIIFLTNVTAWGFYLPTEWNFNYQNSYDKNIFRKIAETSHLRTSCMKIPECKLILDQYNFNRTITTDIILL